MFCMICDSDRDIRHINLYVVGSEGLSICHVCEMALVAHIHQMKAVGGRAKLLVYKRKKIGCDA